MDRPRPTETIREQTARMLAQSKQPVAEGWGIHDCEDFGSFSLPEFKHIDQTVEVAFLITEHGPAFSMLRRPELCG